MPTTAVNSSAFSGSSAPEVSKAEKLAYGPRSIFPKSLTVLRALGDRSINQTTSVGPKSTASLTNWLAILATTIAFWRVTVPAGVLFLPYLCWVTFASALYLQLWRLNS